MRAKISPAPVSRTSLQRLSELALPVLLDYNCAASDDAQVIEQVARIRDVADVVAVEQPYAVGNVVDFGPTRRAAGRAAQHRRGRAQRP